MNADPQPCMPPNNFEKHILSNLNDKTTVGRCDATMLHRSASVPLLVLETFQCTVQFFHFSSCANTCNDRTTVRNAINRVEKNHLLCYCLWSILTPDTKLFYYSLYRRQSIQGWMVFAWACRLGSFLFIRVLKEGGDKRFDKVRGARQEVCQVRGK